MNEDRKRKRNRKDHGPENMALLRWLALNLAKLEGSKGSMRESASEPGGMTSS
jgi:predicted transposase YbfD/YdcC